VDYRIEIRLSSNEVWKEVYEVRLQSEVQAFMQAPQGINELHCCTMKPDDDSLAPSN
jgi:hypothetical protein